MRNMAEAAAILIPKHSSLCLTHCLIALRYFVRYSGFTSKIPDTIKTSRRMRMWSINYYYSYSAAIEVRVFTKETRITSDGGRNAREITPNSSSPLLRFSPERDKDLLEIR